MILITVFRYKNGNYKEDDNQLFSANKEQNKVMSLNFNKGHFMLDSRKSFLTILLNSGIRLPKETELPSLEVFKSRFDKHVDEMVRV